MKRLQLFDKIGLHDGSPKERVSRTLSEVKCAPPRGHISPTLRGEAAIGGVWGGGAPPRIQGGVGGLSPPTTPGGLRGGIYTCFFVFSFVFQMFSGIMGTEV